MITRQKGSWLHHQILQESHWKTSSLLLHHNHFPKGSKGTRSYSSASSLTVPKRELVTLILSSYLVSYPKKIMPRGLAILIPMAYWTGFPQHAPLLSGDLLPGTPISRSTLFQCSSYIPFHIFYFCKFKSFSPCRCFQSVSLVASVVNDLLFYKLVQLLLKILSIEL